MRPLLRTIALTAPLAACITVSPSPGAPPAAPYDAGLPAPEVGYPQGEEPLRARLFPTLGDGDLSFDLSRPAYVAVFEILPGRGARLLYPSELGQERLLDAGYNRRFLPEDGRGDEGAYAYGYSATAYAGGHGSYSTENVRYRYLIASERPLPVSQFVHSPLALRSVLGYSTAETLAPYAALDRLTSYMLPGATPDGSWTTDLVVDWPGDPRGVPSYGDPARYEMIRCLDGRVIFVPRGSGVRSCPGDLIRHPAHTDSTTGGTPADSARPVPPPDPGHPVRPPLDSARVHRPGRGEGDSRATDAGRTDRGRELRPAEQPERPAGPQQPEQPERPERPGRPERPEQPDRPERPTNGPPHAGTPTPPEPGRPRPTPPQVPDRARPVSPPAKPASAPAAPAPVKPAREAPAPAEREPAEPAAPPTPSPRTGPPDTPGRPR